MNGINVSQYIEMKRLGRSSSIPILWEKADTTLWSSVENLNIHTYKQNKNVDSQSKCITNSNSENLEITQILHSDPRSSNIMTIHTNKQNPNKEWMIIENSIDLLSILIKIPCIQQETNKKWNEKMCKKKKKIVTFQFLIFAFWSFTVSKVKFNKIYHLAGYSE